VYVESNAYSLEIVPSSFFTLVLIFGEQVEVHPHCRQNKLRAFCREKGIQLCAFSPLGAKGTAWANNSVMECPVLKQIAHEKGKTVAQVNFAKTK
jgi:diketogulonate reductase-like aldo/keto reductase